MSVAIGDISEAASRAGLVGCALCVHASLRSFGWVRGGPQAVVDGLLAQGCTVMVPAFSWEYLVPPPPDQRPLRNGWDYDKSYGPMEGTGRIYSPDTSDIDKDMGTIPAALVAMEGQVRGNHPLCSFAGIGPLATELVAGQGPLDAFAPLRELSHAGGLMVLMGVGLTSMTALHLAEQMAGRKLFRRWANGSDGQPMPVEVGGCSDGFYKLEPVLAPLEQQIVVGRSLWRIFPAEALLERAASAIRENSALTHCGNSDCERCNDALAGGPII